MDVDELPTQLNAANALAPAFAALCGNSALCAGNKFGQHPKWGEFSRVSVSGRDEALKQLARQALSAFA